MTSPAGRQPTVVTMDDEFEKYLQIKEEIKGQTPNKERRNSSVANVPIITYPKHTKTQEAIAIVIASTAALITIIVAPLLSILAIPYFACKALYKWVEYRPFYNDTLTNGSRERFGRVTGQDYTRWNGKAVNQDKSLTLEQQQHEWADACIHGSEDRAFMENHDT